MPQAQKLLLLYYYVNVSIGRIEILSNFMTELLREIKNELGTFPSKWSPKREPRVF